MAMFRPCGLHSFSWSGSNAKEKMVPTWSKNGPGKVPKSRQSIVYTLRPYWPSLSHFRALFGLDIKLGQTWSQHGPKMV